MDQLPDEMVMGIVAMMNVPGVVRLGMTCKRMHMIARDERLWKHHMLTLCPDSTMCFGDALRHGKDWIWLYRAHRDLERNGPAPTEPLFWEGLPARTGRFSRWGKDAYIGDMVQDTPHGYGYMACNYSFLGTITPYEAQYSISPRYPNGRVTHNCRKGAYEGQWAFGKHDGWGRHTWSCGAVYDGAWSHGRFHGEGTFTWSNGTRYSGQWSGGKKHGTGVMEASCGDRYTGEWQDDKKCGYGAYAWSDGSRYVGDWDDDQKHGNGVMFYVNGDVCIGQWHRDRPHGTGTGTVRSS